MNINTITAEDLRRMPDKEGLILQGCGGDLTEWVDGINEMLTKAGILKDGCQFENVAAFQHGELTCLLYPFDDVKLDIGKLALWRLQTHEVYGGTWLSDFVPNYLGGFIETPEALADKPDCPLIGADGNIFNLLGIASRTLREHGLKEQAKEMSDRVFVSGSYGEALCIIGEYVNITDSKKELSKGMQMKLMLACAFSYDAKLLILDEPTSGLDPVSRDELLKILSEYIEDGEHSVLFSTHITGDLERAADYITYISYGELYFTGSKDDFVDMFRIVKGGIEELSDDLKNKAAGIRTFPTGFEALMKTEDISGFPNLTVDPATIDEIVVFTSKKGDDYE